MSASAIRIALGLKAAATEIYPKETTWAQICKKLTTVKIGAKDGPGWVPADIDPGPRRNDRVRSVSVLVLDVEIKNGATPPDVQVFRSRLELIGYDAHVHTTYNHDSNYPRYRVIFRLAAPVPPAMLKQALSVIADKAGLTDCWDQQCTDPARLFYLPRCPEDKVHLFQAFTVKGNALSLTALEKMITQDTNTNVLPFPALTAQGHSGIPNLAETKETIAQIKSMLGAVSADCDRETWRNVVWALMSTGWQCAYTLAIEWSQTAPNKFDQEEFDKVVRSFKFDGGISTGTLNYYAKLSGWAEDDTKASTSSERFTFRSPDELRNQPPLKWRVKGLLPKTGLAAIIGLSGSGKTFLALELIANIARGENFFGFKTESCPVTYLALEGAGGVGNRIRAYEQYHAQNLPENFKVVTDRLSLLKSDAAVFAKAVAEEGLQDGVIVIDTLAQASPEADENASADMGRIIGNAQLLQTMTSSLVILIHHLGKEASRGARGHSSLTAALDAVIEVRRTGDKRAWVLTKSKDGEDGTSRPFRLEVVNLGVDDDGDPITSCATVADGAAIFARSKLTGKHQIKLWDAISKTHSTGDGISPGDLQEIANAALGSISNKKVRIGESIQALTDKGYLTRGDGGTYVL